ncbi:arsenic resistance protein [Haloplanus sp.]|uniref:arsenic resistance protein n=1 Tax=Haloplanus sp. TaxID=1961696 RepID=UPI00261E1F89|nr:arsenic resistance protein [Haloplanus sp.]
MQANEWLRRHQVLVYAAAVALSVAVGAGRPAWATHIENGINPILAVLLYVTFLEIPFVRFRHAFTNGRFIGAALGLNFLVVPVVVWGLTRALPSDRVILVGVLLVLLTPCIDYVITFTDLADGDAEQLTATTPVLMLAQLLLLPVYLWLFVGPEFAAVVEAGPFVEAFVLLIALPLGLAWLTEAGAEQSPRIESVQEALGWFPVPMMGMTLFVVIASQFPRVQGAFDRIAVVVPVYVAFLLIMPLLGRLSGGLLGMAVGERRALVFTSVTRNSLVVLPLALALPAGYELVPAIVVTQTLVELSGMVVLTRVVPTVLLPASSADDDQPTAPGGE